MVERSTPVEAIAMIVGVMMGMVAAGPRRNGRSRALRWTARRPLACAREVSLVTLGNHAGDDRRPPFASQAGVRSVAGR